MTQAKIDTTIISEGEREPEITESCMPHADLYGNISDGNFAQTIQFGMRSIKELLWKLMQLIAVKHM